MKQLSVMSQSLAHSAMSPSLAHSAMSQSVVRVVTHAQDDNLYVSLTRTGFQGFLIDLWRRLAHELRLCSDISNVDALNGTDASTLNVPWKEMLVKLERNESDVVLHHVT